jgi:DNA replication protein DnaC
MQAKLNFNQHLLLLELRGKDPKFLELDNRVRSLLFKVGKGAITKTDEANYKKLAKQRDEIFNKYIAEHTSKTPKAEFGAKTDKILAGRLEIYCAKFPNAKLSNIVFIGATGTGKTYCAKIMAQKLEQRGFSVVFDTAYNLIKTVRIDGIPQCDLLIIDDLGAEPDQRNNLEYLYTVIAEKYENNMPFIVTTNLSQEQLHSIYDDRIYSRLFDRHKTAVIKFDGEDMRLN